MKFKDLKGQEVDIGSQEDISLLKKIYDGQNFVQIQIGGKLPQNRGHGHGGHKHRHHKERSHSKERHGGNRKDRKITVLAKIYGGEPNQYEAFAQENNDLKMGKLIKAYAEKNGGFEKIMKKDKGERKAKILSKAFGG